MAQHERVGRAQSEGNPRHVADIVKRVCREREHFVVMIFVELASVSFKGRNSPFRDGKNVDERVRRLLETADDTFDLYAFANEFGQHVVEKAFCGGRPVFTLQ